MFTFDEPIRLVEIADGQSNTLLIGERPPSPDFWYGWWYATGAGSNGYRVTLFRDQLQNLSDRMQRTIRVSHIPPYCSKYNPIDHRVFCHVARSLQSLLLTSVEVIRDAIARTTTRTGLRVTPELARIIYPAKEKASPQYLANPSIIRDQFLGQFNYQFKPNKTPKLFFT